MCYGKQLCDMTFAWYHGLLIGSVMAVILIIGYGLLRYQLWEVFETCNYTTSRRRNRNEMIELRSDQIVTISYS